MPRKKLGLAIIATAFLLAGCLATPEEQIANGMAEVQTAFGQEPEDTNESTGQLEFYLPGGYTVEEPSDENNMIITKGSDSFVLFVNPNESADSRLFYDLQKANPEQEWAADETFEENGRFGFATVRSIAEDRYELVVSAGGVKMTTISEESKIDENMEWMMRTVRSIDNEK